MRLATMTVDRTLPLLARGLLLLTALCGLGGGLGGCANIGAANPANAQAGMTTGATVAFESVDGPPPQVFDRMVGVLDSESKLRNLSIVSREGTPIWMSVARSRMSGRSSMARS